MSPDSQNDGYERVRNMIPRLEGEDYGRNQKRNHRESDIDRGC